MHKDDARLLRELERHLDSASRVIRELLGVDQADHPGAVGRRPRTGTELRVIVGIGADDAKRPPYALMQSYLLRFGPTRKSELVKLFADALEAGYSSRGRAIGSMVQAININAGKANASAIAVEVRGVTLAQVPYIPQRPFKPRSLPEPMLLEKYCEPDQLIALPRHAGMPASVITKEPIGNHFERIAAWTALCFIDY